jgi:hypothetical protein
MKKLLLLSFAIFLVYACDDSPKSSQVDDLQVPTSDLSPMADAQASDQKILVTDLAVDAQVDALIDAFVPPPHLDAPKAKVYLHDPVTDASQLTEVELAKTTDPLGILTNEAVAVFNCLNEPGGVGGMVNFGGFTVRINLCREEQVARPDRDGHYLSIVPPLDDLDPNDEFAEVMMYHHVNQIFNYYKEKHAFVRYEEPLPALVNVQFTTTPRLNFPGFTPNADGFIPFDNALFFPKENWEAFASQFGLPPRDQDSIIFFQGQADFAYDASVIYHEYTHAVIGINRLLGSAADQYGLDTSPGGMNEGLADYFAASALNEAIVGNYGIGKVDPKGGRNLSVVSKCPDQYSWEVHAQGKIIGSTMWAVRNAIGQEQADQIMFNALLLFNQNTTHQQASELILAEAAMISADLETQVRSILTDYGMLNCVRSTPWVNWNVEDSLEKLPFSVSTAMNTGVFDFGSIGTPHNLQFSINNPENRAGIKLTWYMEAGQSFGGPPPSLKPLQLALRKNQLVTFEYQPEVKMNHDELFTAYYNNGKQEIYLSKDCLGDQQLAHSLFINKNGPDTWITKMEIEYVDELPNYAELCIHPVDMVDAGVVDAGVVDASVVDAGVVDAGVVDASSSSGQ